MSKTELEVLENKYELLRNELDGLEREKKGIVEKYQKKVITIQQELDGLESKVKNIDSVFKAEFGAKVDTLDRREKEIKDDMAVFVSEKNTFAKTLTSFKKDKKVYEDLVREEMEKINSLKNKASSLMNNAESENSRIAVNTAKNSTILEDIKKQTAIAKNALQNLDDGKKQIIADKNSAAIIKARAKVIFQEAEKKMENARALEQKVVQTVSSIKTQKKEAEKLIIESDLISKNAAEKKTEIESLIKETDDKIKQIALETEKNQNNSIINRAKEISLNEKERALNERERSIKILQEKL